MRIQRDAENVHSRVRPHTPVCRPCVAREGRAKKKTETRSRAAGSAVPREGRRVHCKKGGAGEGQVRGTAAESQSFRGVHRARARRPATAASAAAAPLATAPGPGLASASLRESQETPR